jgi:hypothetical protein
MVERQTGSTGAGRCVPAHRRGVVFVATIAPAAEELQTLLHKVVARLMEPLTRRGTLRSSGA